MADLTLRERLRTHVASSRTWLLVSLVVAIVVTFSRPAAAGQEVRKDDYVIGPQDVLSIVVVDEPELSGKFGVNEDGSFTFPLIGRVQAAGLTASAVERNLTQRLRDGRYLDNPRITVSLDEAGSRRYFVWGEVRQPGRYVIRGEISLIEALARAGFTTPQAGGSILIRRAARDGSPAAPSDSAPNAASEDVLRVALKDLERGGITPPMVRDGDTIFVSAVDTVYVLGEVRGPGAFRISEGMTVRQALALAGGATDRAAVNRLRIERLVDGKPVQIRPELTDPLQPGDTIVVPQRFF
jgi:polysaccharide export outer membrane protein